MNSIKIPKEGSRWTSYTENKTNVFRILSITTIEENTWVHYISENTTTEFSCYLESFLSRFSELP